MKTTNVQCEWCNINFNISQSEFNRKKKKRTSFFCSRTCSAHHRNATVPKNSWAKQYERNKSVFDIKTHASNRLDEYSPFRTFLSSGRRSIQKHEVKITPAHLKEVWESQRGICPYTGIKMLLPPTTKDYTSTRNLSKASLDRIDSSKGYIEGNVEFVCMAINLAKNNHSKKEMVNFINSIDREHIQHYSSATT